MTFSLLRPASTTGNSGAVTGAASAHAALSDDSDSSYVTFDNVEGAAFTLGDLTLPSGAVIVMAQVWMRMVGGPARVDSRVVADSTADGSTSVYWGVPTEAYGALIFGGLTDAGVDAATLSVLNANSAGSVVMYEAGVRVQYLTQPTVTVTLPTGTIDENVVTVNWTPSFDTHAQASQYWREVKIYSSAQYGGGGFDPDVTVPTAESGEILSGLWFHTFDATVLPDGDYRAYVKVAAENSPTQWSAWDYEAFTVDAPNPGVPTMTLTGQNSDGRIKIDLDDNTGDVGTNLFQVQRSDDGGTTWVDLRTDIVTTLGGGWVLPTGGLATVYDYEAPNGVTCSYRARAWNEATPSYSAWTATDTEAWTSDDVWLKNALYPSQNLKITLRSYASSQVAANQGVFRALGSSTATVVSDVRGPETGQIVVLTDDQDARDALNACLDAQSPMLLQVPASNEQPERWVVFGDQSSERLADHAWISEHDETLPWTRVARPDGAIEE
jgi:hypothetical protein